MTDFKVKKGIDSFRFRGRSYRPGDTISLTDEPGLKVLKDNPLVEAIQVQAPAQPAPAPAVQDKKAKSARKK